MASASEALEARLVTAGAEKADAVHHRLPQFYLRGFVGRSGKLRLVDPVSGQSRLARATTN